MARITGIGGVFLKAKDPKALMQWYATNLGLELSEYGGATLLWSDEIPAGTGSTTWSLFAETTKHFGEGPQTAMINYRVDDLQGILKQLEAAGAWIDPKRDSAEYGHFAWARDPEGNRFELWQPLADPEPETT